MRNVQAIIREHKDLLLKLVPLLAFAVPLSWLYFLYPDSFELMWKGRTFQLFFVWLIALELILGWEILPKPKITKLFSPKSLAVIIALLLPTMYVVLASYAGLNTAIADMSKQSGFKWAEQMPLSTEYLVFALLFGVMVYLYYGKRGLKDYSVPVFFLAIVGAIYTIDNIYPYGQFTPFQIFVPTTATVAASVLSLSGYNTSMIFKQDPASGTLPYITAVDPANPSRNATFAIAWPCAGIESFLIFAVVTILFLKRMPISWKDKIGYFAVGAAVTYLINIWRIVTIFTIGINGGNVDMFHFYYGPLYAVAWIVSYPLIILGSQGLWRKITPKKDDKLMTTQPERLTPA